MTAGKTKATGIISNVVSVHESTRIVKNVQKTKFSIHVDENTDITNDKWMTLMVRYVDPTTLLVKIELLELIHLDATDGSAKSIFGQFCDSLAKLGISLEQIIGLACDNASVMVGKRNSFKILMTEKIPNLLTLLCICHSLALASKEACSKIPIEVHDFLTNVVSFIKNSPKRSALFADFQDCYEESPTKLVRFAATRWLSRQIAITKVLNNWQAISAFLIDQSSEKAGNGDDLLAILQKPTTKAYLLFLKSVLESFNKINANIQGSNTLVHELQPCSKKLLVQFLRRFMKFPLLKPEIFVNNVRDINFEEIANQRNLLEVDVGADCQEYLLIQQTSGVPELIINQVRNDCLQFLVTASLEICRRLPIDDPFLSDLTVFAKETALFDPDRNSSFSKVEKTCLTLDVPGGRLIQVEWSSLYCVDPNLKEQWSKLSFDEMWIEMCTFTHSDGTLQFPTLRLLLSVVRALPHSNAAAERAFSLIPDIKTKNRNSLNHKTLNSLCVIKSVSNSGNLRASEMSIDKDYVGLMSSCNLYSTAEKAAPKRLNLYPYDSSDDC
ncbi:protein FAM200B-like [Cotesia typhae]|uniref:protein FAM200B-like n=1 Tax=Cotesia typhae TaxID=2053667 RepID=UPI003D689C3F